MSVSFGETGGNPVRDRRREAHRKTFSYPLPQVGTMPLESSEKAEKIRAESKDPRTHPCKSLRFRTARKQTLGQALKMKFNKENAQ